MPILFNNLLKEKFFLNPGVHIAYISKKDQVCGKFIKIKFNEFLNEKT
jgi:hypothetical protein